MELVLLMVVVALVLYVAYLQVRLSTIPSQTIVVVPSTTDQESGVGCTTIALILVFVVIVLAILGVFPAIA